MELMCKMTTTEKTALHKNKTVCFIHVTEFVIPLTNTDFATVFSKCVIYQFMIISMSVSVLHLLRYFVPPLRVGPDLIWNIKNTF